MLERCGRPRSSVPPATARPWGPGRRTGSGAGRPLVPWAMPDPAARAVGEDAGRVAGAPAAPSRLEPSAAAGAASAAAAVGATAAVAAAQVSRAG